jgi:hypothetical protein
MPSLDIFNDDAFSLVSMTKAITETPYQPGRIGELGWFSTEGISTTSVMIERTGSTLSLVPTAARGAPGKPIHGDKSKLVSIPSVHLPQRATISADEVQNIRTFGSETEVESVQNVVNKRLVKMRRDIDTTMEWMKVGAMKGQVLDADGTTVLYNMFTLFGVSQQTKDMNLDADTTKVRNMVVDAKRMVEAELGGLSYRSLRVLCSPEFFDSFVAHPGVEAAFNRWNDGQFLREDQRTGFGFGGVFWEEYRGSVSGQQFIEANSAYLVPEGVPDMFVGFFAPADYMETANTMGLPYYAKQELMRMGKGVEIESQSNPIMLNTRPRAVVKLVRT